MRSILFLFVFLPFTMFAKTKALVATGGHKFDQAAFTEMFDSFNNFEWKHIPQPEFNEYLEKGNLPKADVWIFYDMYQPITEGQKEAYLAATKAGQPMLFLHHALVSYQKWDEFMNILGGRYFGKKHFPELREEDWSTYLLNTNVEVRVNQNHPICEGVTDFMLYDEVYGNYKVNDDVIPILSTNHPNSEKLIGWEHRYENSKIVFLQPGHGVETYASEPYRKLLQNAVQFLTNE